jgi:hypothetical protein
MVEIKPESGTVELIGAALDYFIGHRTAAAAELRTVSIGEDRNFSDCFHVLRERGVLVLATL